MRPRDGYARISLRQKYRGDKWVDINMDTNASHLYHGQLEDAALCPRLATVDMDGAFGKFEYSSTLVVTNKLSFP